MTIEIIQQQAESAVSELLASAKLHPGDLVVVGCSSSEVGGSKIGSNSSTDIADAIFSVIWSVLKRNNLYLAAQCCEHLNRALIMERAAAEKFGYEPVNVVPQPKAGGSFATAAYREFDDPVAVEHIQASAGLDIGDTFIGMHLKPVAVPVRLSVNSIGEAHLTCARTRPKFIGGVRAHYDESKM